MSQPPPSDPLRPPSGADPTADPAAPPAWADPSAAAPPSGPPVSGPAAEPSAASPWADPSSQSVPPGPPPQADATRIEPPRPPAWGPPPGPSWQAAPVPGPPPKKSSVPIVAVIVASVLLLCAGTVTTGVILVKQAVDKAEAAVDQARSAVPAPPDLPDLPDLPSVPALPGGGTGSSGTHTVVYEVTGDGPIDVIYTDRATGKTRTLTAVKLPWRISQQVTGRTVVASVSALRKSTDDGTVTCRATVDGREVARRSRTGGFATAFCFAIA